MHALLPRSGHSRCLATLPLLRRIYDKMARAIEVKCSLVECFFINAIVVFTSSILYIFHIILLVLDFLMASFDVFHFYTVSPVFSRAHIYRRPPFCCCLILQCVIPPAPISSFEECFPFRFRSPITLMIQYIWL